LETLKTLARRAGGNEDRRMKRVFLSAVMALAATVLATAEPSRATSAACEPGYSPCLPAKADLYCDQINDASKSVRVTGEDPYQLDRDRDGLGCEVAGEGGGAKSPWG
jgi:resuscitation-promoting factor RpfB